MVTKISVFKMSFFAAMIVAFSWSHECAGQLQCDFETGVAWTGYNDVRLPGDQDAEPLSLSDELSADPALFYRLQMKYTFNERHALLMLAAPFRTRSSGSVDRDIIFNNVLFPANQPLTVRYRFDSYRLRYAYTLYKSEKVSFSGGVTAKIRDASIRVESDTMKSEYVNTGFVP
ncbi:hypothetical protein JXQ70_19515, partial [bacterium]|nr:hypothetical protein [bacterium]